MVSGYILEYITCTDILRTTTHSAGTLVPEVYLDEPTFSHPFYFYSFSFSPSPSLSLAGVHNAVGGVKNVLKPLSDGILASAEATKFLLQIGGAIQEKASIPFLNGLMEILRSASNNKVGAEKKLSRTEMFFGFMTLTSVITAVVLGFAGDKSAGGVFMKVLGKIGKLVAGVVGAILAVKHLYDRIMGVIAARDEYAARTSLAVVNGLLSKKEVRIKLYVFFLFFFFRCF